MMTMALPGKVFPLLLLGLGAILIGISAYFISQDVALQSDFSTVPVNVNYPAPDLTLTDTQGISHSLADCLVIL